MTQKLIVEIAGDTSAFERAMKSAGSTADGFGSKLGSIAKTAGLVAGGAALGGLALTLKTGIDEWKQSTLVATQTQAVLKSTGGAAGVTAKQVSDLAGALLKKTGIDDEAIQSGENLLLTFTGIRNEAGKGNDVFTQSTKIMADMSTALGQDMKSSAIQLGKALNDPVKGVTALQRVGVSFTQAQRDQIKAMVDSGNTMGAQKLILGELNKEFGGSAEAAGKTLPGQLNVLKESFNNMAGQIVGSMMPALTGVTSWVNSTGLPVLQQLGDKVSAFMQPAFRAFGDYVQNVSLPVLRELWDVFNADLLPIIEQVGSVFTTAVTKISGVVHDHMPEIHTIFSNLGKVIRNIADVVMPLIKFAFEKVLPVALRVAIPVLELVTGALKGVTEVLKDVFKWGGDVAVFFTGLPAKLGAAFKGAAGALEAVLKAPLNALISAWDSIKIPSFHVHIPIPFAPDINFDTPSIGLPQIPSLAVGASSVLSSGLAVIHRGEQIVPARVQSPYRADSRGGGDTFVFNFSGYMGDKQALIRDIRNELLSVGLRNAVNAVAFG